MSHRRSNKTNKQAETKIRRGYDNGIFTSKRADEFNAVLAKVQAERPKDFDEALDELKERFST